MRPITQNIIYKLRKSHIHHIEKSKINLYYIRRRSFVLLREDKQTNVFICTINQLACKWHPLREAGSYQTERLIKNLLDLWLSRHF